MHFMIIFIQFYLIINQRFSINIVVKSMNVVDVLKLLTIYRDTFFF